MDFYLAKREKTAQVRLLQTINVALEILIKIIRFFLNFAGFKAPFTLIRIFLYPLLRHYCQKLAQNLTLTREVTTF